MEFKTVPLELRASGEGEVEGYASTWDTLDSYGDRVQRGAFAKSLASGRKTRLLWQHDMTEPIGIPLALYEDHKGLYGKWKIVPTTTGTKARELIKHELLDGLSIGFVPVDAEYQHDGVRLLKEVQLFEVSVVTLPANEDARITGWKRAPQRAGQRGRLTLQLAEMEHDQRRRQMRHLGVRFGGSATLAQLEQDLRRRRLQSMGVRV